MKTLKSEGDTDDTDWIWGLKKGLKAYDVANTVELNFRLVADLK